jgi:RNA polymerase sigma factor (sigma-70 family)
MVLSIYTESMADLETGHAVLDKLLENRRAFLAYLTRRVGDRAMAEDLLQEAFAKTLARPGPLPEGDALVPWFYRTLRNAAVDRFRRQGAADRALEAFARELETAEAVPDETRHQVCQCISRLATTLRPDYAEALLAIEVEGQPVKTYAERKGLTAGNAAVRVFRAREALKQRVVESCGACAEHGCLNCTCQAAV